MSDKPACRRCGGPAGGIWKLYCLSECEKPSPTISIDLSWDLDELQTTPPGHASYKCGYCFQYGVFDVDDIAKGLGCPNCNGVLWRYP